MANRYLVAALVAGFIATPGAAMAGVYTDDLGRCLVKATTPEDQTAFIKWMFIAMSLHPTVAEYANVTTAQREEANKGAGALMNKLLLEKCRDATVEAVKYEGLAALQGGFQVFGQVAGVGLMNHEAVNAGLQGLSKHFDEAKMKELLTAAGVPTK